MNKQKALIGVLGTLGTLASLALMWFQGWVGDKQVEMLVDERVQAAFDERFGEEEKQEEEEEL